MALSPALANISARYKALPRQQQLAVLFGIPAAIFLGFSYLTFQVRAQLGADPSVSPLLAAHQGGIWATIESTKDEITQKEQIIAKKAEIVKEIDGIKDAIRTAEERLPREAEKASMRETIEKLARDIQPPFGNVQLKSVRILENEERGQAKSDYRTVVYQTEILGDMNGIIKYIDSIEKNERFMTVNSVALKAGEVTMDTKLGKVVYAPHQVKMDLVTYVYSGTGKKGGQP